MKNIPVLSTPISTIVLVIIIYICVSFLYKCLKKTLNSNSHYFGNNFHLIKISIFVFFLSHEDQMRIISKKYKIVITATHKHTHTHI